MQCIFYRWIHNNIMAKTHWWTFVRVNYRLPVFFTYKGRAYMLLVCTSCQDKKSSFQWFDFHILNAQQSVIIDASVPFYIFLP